MIQEIAFTPSTIVVVLAVLACAVFAVRRLLRRGMCDCDDHCVGCSGSRNASGCHGCSAADDMVARMEAEAKSRLG